MSTKLIRLKAVQALTGLSKSSIYDFMNAGTFPKSVSLGCRAVAWSETEIQEWIEAKLAQRNEVA